MTSLVVSKKAKLARLQDVVANRPWHTQVLAARLKMPVHDSNAARSRLSALLREQAADHAPFDWDAELRNMEAHQPTDAQRWAPVMGDVNDNYVAGLAASDITNGGDGHQYVVVNVCDEKVSQRLQAFFNAHPEMTVSEFVDSPQYRLSRSYQERNARRVAARIAAAIDPATPVHHIIDVSEDERTARSRSDNLRGEMLANPTYHVVYNCIDTTNLPAGVSSAHQGRGCLYRSNEANAHHQSAIIKVLDPASGFLVRRVNPATTPTEPVFVQSEYDNHFDNPVYTKKKENRQALKKHVASAYLNRDGETPSSASRPLWQRTTKEEVMDGDVKLTPLVFIIHGARAASSATRDE